MTTPNHDNDHDRHRIIENEDAGLQYSKGWNVVIPDPREKRVGMTWTDRAKASVEVQFYGTSISVYGRIFDTTSSDLAFVVSLDGAVVGQSASIPHDSGAVSQQVFSTPLVGLSNHTLTLTMRADGVPLYLDYFNVTLDVASVSTDVPTPTGSANTTFSNSAGMAVSVSSTIDPRPTLLFWQSHPTTPVGGIVGGVLGGIVFVAFGVLWVALRRRKRRAEREDELDKEIERVVPGWKRDPEKKGDSGAGGERGRGASGKSKSHGGSKGKRTSRSRGHKPPRLKPITFARDPEDWDDSESPTTVSQVMNLKQEGYRSSPSESLPPISPVSPFHEAEFAARGRGGDGAVGHEGSGSSVGDHGGAQVSGIETRERGGGVDAGETQARGMVK